MILSRNMYGLLLQIVSGIIGLYLASKFIEGFVFNGDVIQLFVAGVILGAVNFFVKPILKIILLPLRLLTLGLFTFVINIAILWGVDRHLETLTIGGIAPLLWGTILISILSIVLGRLLKSKNKPIQ